MTGNNTTSRVDKLVDTINTICSDSSIIVATVAEKCLKEISEIRSKMKCIL